MKQTKCQIHGNVVSFCFDINCYHDGLDAEKEALIRSRKKLERKD